MKKNNTGFTLIELLAVIIILAILLIIAIPSVTTYISDSRKSSYINTAKEVIGGARNLINEGKLGTYATDVTYYIDGACIPMENEYKSPYADFDITYVVVTYDGTGYNYYWTGVDQAGQGIKKAVEESKLKEENIESDLKSSDIVPTIGIDGRSKYMIIDKEHTSCKAGESFDVTGNIDTNAEGVTFPAGKNKETVVVGDIVKIGNEEFYVVKHSGNDLVLLAHYNLKVGYIYNSRQQYVGEYSSSDPGYGIQSSEAKGWAESGNYYGVIEFSSTPYWKNNLDSNEYPGHGCGTHGHNPTSYSYTPGSGCTYVYNSNSTLYSYVQKYKSYLESLGANVKGARLLTIDEAYELGATIDDYSGAPSWLYETAYWFGSLDNSGEDLPANHQDYSAKYEWVWSIDPLCGELLSFWYGTEVWHGIRPVIII